MITLARWVFAAVIAIQFLVLVSLAGCAGVPELWTAQKMVCRDGKISARCSLIDGRAL